MYTEERQKQIVAFIKQSGTVVDVATLAKKFEKSPETIRRDLRRLEKLDMVKRTHGGAEIKTRNNSEFIQETPLDFRQGINTEKKLMIAKRAAEFVHNEDVILLDDSTTVSYMLRYLPRNYTLTIITNSIQVVNLVYRYSSDTNWTVVCLGGIFRSKSYSLAGFLAVNTLSTFRPNKFFLSCGGIDANGNLTEGDLSMVELKREFLARSKETYLLIDDSKIDAPSSINLFEMREVDCLIISEINANKMERVKKMGAKYIITV